MSHYAGSDPTSGDLLTFSHPAEWEVIPAVTHMPHGFPLLAIAHRADPDCRGGDLMDDCQPTLSPGGTLIWWRVELPAVRDLTIPRDEMITIAGEDARLSSELELCQYLKAGQGLDPAMVDIEMYAAFQRGLATHGIIACFRDPTADASRDAFLELLESIAFDAP